MLKLKQFRDRTQGLPDLLNFAMMPQGRHPAEQGRQPHGELVFPRRGYGQRHSSGTGWYFRALERHSGRSRQRLDAQLRCHPQAATTYPSNGHFPDRTSWLIDVERRRQYEHEGAHFETTYALSLTYLPPLRTSNRIVEMIYEDEGRDDSAEGFATRIVEQFKRQVDDFESALSATLPLRRMRGIRRTDFAGREYIEDELLQYMDFCVSGVLRPGTLACHSDVSRCADRRLSLYGGIAPRVGDMHIKVVAIDGFPHDSYPGVLHALDELGYEYRWATRFIFLDPQQARSVINGARRRWQQKQRGLKDQVFNTSSGAMDLDALEMTEDAQSAIGEAESNQVRFGYYTSCVVMMHTDRELLMEQAREARKALLNLGFGARIEDINAVEGYLGAIPGHGYPNVRRPILHTLNLADLLPVTAVLGGAAKQPVSVLSGKQPAAVLRRNYWLDPVSHQPARRRRPAIRS